MGNMYPVSNNGAAPLEYGIGGPRIGVKTIALDTATTDKEYEIGGNVLWIADASDLDAKISIKYQDQTNDSIPIQKGSFLAGPSFSRLYISWTAQAGKTVTLLYTVESGKRPFRVDNAIANYTGVTVVGTADVDIVGQSGADPLNVEETHNIWYSLADVSLAAGAVTMITTWDNLYREQIITNLATNTQTFRLGAAAVTTGASQGIPIAPGETVIISARGPVYGYNPGGSAESVAVSIVLKD